MQILAQPTHTTYFHLPGLLPHLVLCLRLLSQARRPKAQPSTICSAGLGTAIISRIIQADLSWSFACKASETSAQLLFYTDTCTIAFEAARLVHVRVVDTRVICGTGLVLVTAAATADLDFMEACGRCWVGALGYGYGAGDGFDGCGTGQTWAGLRESINM